MTVCLEAFRIFPGCDLQSRRLACCLHLISAFFLAVPVIAYRLKNTGLESNILECKEEFTFPSVKRKFLSIEEEFHIFAVGNHEHMFHSAGIVVPVTDDIGLRCLGVNPSVPHHLVCIEAVLRDTHRVSDTASTIVFRASVMGVRIREYDLHATGTDSFSCSRTFPPVVVPTTYKLLGKFILIVVVALCRLASVERTVTFHMVRITLIVPELTESLVAAIFHSPERMMLALVDIEHLASELCLTDVKHLTCADGTSAIWVIHIPDCLHLYHVLTGNRFVSALIEDNARIVPVIYDRIPHQVCTMHPLTALAVFFRVSGRHCLRHADAVAGLHILFPRAHMHPTHLVSAALNGEGIGIVTEPCRNRRTYSRPLIGCTLSISMHHEHSVIEPDLALAELCLPESRTGHDLVEHDSFVILESSPDIIKITVAPAPEMHVLELC